MSERIVRDIPALVGKLRELRTRCLDLVASQGAIRFESEVKDGKPQPVTLRTGVESYGIQDGAHTQLSGRFDLHGTYYGKMREKGAHDLLATNLEYWRSRDTETRRLLRLLDGNVRAFLSDKFRPVDHLDILTTAVQVITGRDGTSGEEAPHARGARCMGWSLTPTSLDVALINPTLQIDLKHVERGIQHHRTGGYQPDAPNHGWIRPDADTDGGHWVFPAAFIRNSETGHGLFRVDVGLYESICDNRARIGKEFQRRHVGRALEDEGFYSADTLRKDNAAIFAKVADTIRQAFDPEMLLENARKMAGLASQDADIKDAANRIVRLPGLTEEIRDDILSAYRPLIEGRNTLLDVTRAVTRSAHKYAESDPETAATLETIGGTIIERGALTFTKA